MPGQLSRQSRGLKILVSVVRFRDPALCFQNRAISVALFFHVGRYGMFFSLIIKGGPVMIPIILLSIAGLAIILERLWTLWKIRLNIPPFAQQIFLLLEKRQFQRALELCETVSHPIADVFKLGILNRTLRREEIESMMEREGEEQIQYLEQYLGALITESFKSQMWRKIREQNVLALPLKRNPIRLPHHNEGSKRSEPVEKVIFCRLIKNARMQGARNREK